jgi:hypothetical protein
MPKSISRISGPGVAAGIGAGLAAALLSMVVAQKTSFALAMGFISPLPVMIAALGFGSFAGLIAVAIGTVAVGVFDLRPEGLAFVLPGKALSDWVDIGVFALSLGLPSWLLARIAVAPTAIQTSTVARPEEIRLGRIVAVAVGFASVGVALDFAVAVTKLGGFAAFMADGIAKAEPVVRALLSSNRPMPKGITPHDIAVGVTWAQMPVMSAAGVVLLVFNLWLAARIAQASGLLVGAWPDIPRHTRVPRPLGVALAVALGLSFAGGLVGLMSLVVSGALLMGFALQGLAVIHAVTRGKSFRVPLLIIVYLSMAILMPWLLILYGFIGLLDSGVSFRDRPKKPVTPPGPWQPPPSKNR